ncbi:hypothetical protein [Jannaschia sp. W003]|uniref:hypothetical protein n=1 Tax=Jannaschia sp. W003 TaxID=2867012 RepID=UPI0021A5C6D2|nr:hypothetical protein [Jannaschia sp. W003]UWQ20498.1 hypothetical protein K3554_10920 [Jannaschia sp. W003]
MSDRIAKPGRAAPVALPNVGPLMKAYRAVDWVMLRILGLGLVALAWAIRTLADPEKCAAVLHGITPQTATVVYFVWGLLLAFPVLLPRGIANPHTVLAGALKAALILAATAALLPALDLLVEMQVPRDYRNAVAGAVPNVVKAVAGLAVLSTVAVAFFRQLGAGSRGGAVPDKRAAGPTAEELRELRRSRMAT